MIQNKTYKRKLPHHFTREPSFNPITCHDRIFHSLDLLKQSNDIMAILQNLLGSHSGQP